MSEIDWSEAPDNATHILFNVALGKSEFAVYSQGHGFYETEHSNVKFGRSWEVYSSRPKAIDHAKESSIDDTLNDGDKYLRTIIGMCGTPVQVDVYRVLDAFKTGDPALDHAVKKALCAGQRGHKDKFTDYKNIIESTQKALVLLEQKELL